MSSSASLTSGWRPRSSKLGGFGSAGVSEGDSVVSVCIAASRAAASADPFSVGVVSFVITRNLEKLISPEIIQSGRWSSRGARVRRNQATSLVAARRSGIDAKLALNGVFRLSRVALLLNPNGRHYIPESGQTLLAVDGLVKPRLGEDRGSA
jgi:hypothetical protein